MVWNPNAKTQFVRRFTNAKAMPFYYFDLLVDGKPYGQGGMILEDTMLASDKADALANELNLLSPELRNRGCFVRVMDEHNQELYRAPLDPVVSWSISSKK
jgi:hypothetical protein